MTVKILFFGATSDAVGKREVLLSVNDGSLAEHALAAAVKQYPQLIQHKLNFSINQEYARGDEILRNGDELAIFTAVSGG